MPVRYPLTVLAMGFSMDSLKYASFTTRGLASRNSLLLQMIPLESGHGSCLRPRNGRQCIRVRCIAFRRFWGWFLMTTFGSSDDNLSPAFGRISILNLGFLFNFFNLGIGRFKIQIFIGSGSEIKTESLSGRSGAHLYGY